MISLPEIMASRRLPTIPSIALKLVDLAKQPDVPTKTYVRMIGSDPALTAQILRSVNAAAQGVRYGITSLDHAVNLLGRKRLVTLALNFALLPDVTIHAIGARHYQTYWLRSVLQALAMESLSRRESPQYASEYFLAGLLMDFGQLVLMQTAPIQYIHVIEDAAQEARELHAVEQDQLGLTHVDVGLKLLENYQVSSRLMTGLKHQHASILRLVSEANGENGDLIRATATAATVGDLYCWPNKGRALRRLEKFVEELYRDAPFELATFLQDLDLQLSEIGQLFQLNTNLLVDSKSLVVEAKQQLSLMDKSAVRLYRSDEDGVSTMTL